mmetsp:Transcript_124721/g.216185  ORF Transcript_124721/g.216185 Transcript_124721/m.216185 type:complete len:413 (-) Transcript_124721:121-1359(-)
MASVGASFRRHIAAIGSVTVTSVGQSSFKPALKTEERSWRNPTYVPPSRFNRPFSTLPSSAPLDDAARLAWAVKYLEVDTVKEVLDKWPHGATLMDPEDNTLFHVAASESSRFGAQPKAAKQVFDLLLQHGWQVVDTKNNQGRRAEVVAKGCDPAGVPALLLKNRAHDFTEKLPSERPLQLVGEQSSLPWMWEYAVYDTKRRAFAGVFKRAVEPETCKRWFDACIKDAPWDTMSDGRKVAWFVSEDCWDCPYRYSGHEHQGHVWAPFMKEMLDEVCGKICGIPPEKYPNCCNVNIYPGGTPPVGQVGWHADDEVYFQSLSDDTRIVSFSLGSARDFQWRLQGTDTPLGTVSLGDGDLMTMEGLFQKHYKHAVPPASAPCGPRLNFTFRWIVAKAHAEDAGTAAITGISTAKY